MSDLLNKLLTALIGILVALGAWTLTRTYELSTQQVVMQEKVIKLEQLANRLLEKDKEMSDQHTRLFEMLKNPKHKMPSDY